MRRRLPLALLFVLAALRCFAAGQMPCVCDADALPRDGWRWTGADVAVAGDGSVQWPLHNASGAGADDFSLQPAPRTAVERQDGGACVPCRYVVARAIDQKPRQVSFSARVRARWSRISVF